jgi:hypothetical protein
MGSWLSTIHGRLTAEGYVVQDDFPFEGKTFPVFARQTRFVVTKFGFAENFFTFFEFERLTSDMLRRFSADAFRCANQNRVVPLPCGLGESVWSYAVALAKSVDDATLNSARFDTPPKHFAAAEIPVVYDQTQNKLWYFEKTPLWGAAYYAGFRRQIKRLLG